MRARTLSRDPLELKSARDSSGEDFVFVPFVAKKSGPAISRGVVVSAGPAGFGHYVAGSVGEPSAVFSCLNDGSPFSNVSLNI